MNRKLLSVLAVIVMSLTKLSAQFVITTYSPHCYGGFGEADISPSSGYEYHWNTGATTSYLNAFSNGIYSCTVSDSSGHVLAILTDTIQSPPPLSSNYTIVSPSSCDSCNGSALLIPAGGTPPYTVLWYDGAQTYTHSGLCPGIYNVRFTDSLGCSDSTIYIPVNCNCGLNVTTAQTNVSCDSPSGSVTANVAGGAPPYTYSWFNYGNGHSGSASSYYNLSAGAVWTLSVTDTAGCKYYADGTILNGLGYNYFVYTQSTPVNCSNPGTAFASVFGGYPPYSYTWGTSPVQTTDTAISLPSGNYSVTVTDSLGCITVGNAGVDSSCYETISGTVFLDTTGNCNYSQSSLPLNGVYVIATGAGSSFYGNSDAQGQYSILVPDTGTYTLSTTFATITQCSGTYTVCGHPGDSVNLGTNGENLTGVNIAFTPGSGFDLFLHPGYTSAEPGFDKDYWIYFYNNNPYFPFTGTATVTFQYDPRLVFLSSDVPYTTYDAATHTFTWTATNVQNSPWSYIGRIHFYVPTTLSPYTVLTSYYRIDPFEGDCDTSNNQMTLSEYVIGSRDPNEKDVTPAGSLSDADSVLTYTIHFQNTGNAVTSFITVVDTLPSGVDPASVVNLASNPLYSKFSVSGAGILTWTFTPAFLPDSLSDPNGSKGFVTFSVKLKKGLALGQTINNTASVYFDYNTPVVTNMVSDTVGFTTGIVNTTSQSVVSVKAFPDPFSNTATFIVKGLNESYDFELLDITGRLQRKMSLISTEQFTLNRDGLASGVYLFRISVHNQPAAYGKVVIQ